MEQASEQRSLGALFAELASETGTLVRQEVVLAKTEMVAKAKTAAGDGVVIGIGGALAVLGGLGIFAALILMLALLMPLWASALLVGAVFAGGGAAIAYLGVRKLKRVDPVPRVTMTTLKENKQWLTEQVAR